MQARCVFLTAPVTSVEGVASAQAEGAGHGAVFALGQDQYQCAGHGSGQYWKKSSVNAGVLPFSAKVRR